VANGGCYRARTETNIFSKHFMYKYKTCYMKTATTKKLWDLNKISRSIVCARSKKAELHCAYSLTVDVSRIQFWTAVSTLLSFGTKPPDFHISPKNFNGLSYKLRIWEHYCLLRHDANDLEDGAASVFWKRQVPLERWCPPAKLHGDITQ
jgi:hypothetical protein